MASYPLKAIDAVCNHEFEDKEAARPESFVRFINSWGARKTLFGTDFPVIDPERARSEIENLSIREESKRRFLRDNVIELYKLKLPLSRGA